jgi:hypothetical protein
MTDNTLTFFLDGDVELSDFAEAVSRFYKLVQALSSDAGNPNLEWELQTLELSSALATVRDPTSSDAGKTVIDSYAEVGSALEIGSPIPARYSSEVKTAAKNIATFPAKRAKLIRFETATRDARIAIRKEYEVPDAVEIVGTALSPTAGKLPLAQQKPTVFAKTLGAVEGRIQTLSNRGSLHFTLFDQLYDKAVSCYLSEGREELLRNLWGRLAFVEGYIIRDPASGRPLSIKEVHEITPLAEPKPEARQYEEARGIAPSANNLSPEEAIRRIRDDW